MQQPHPDRLCLTASSFHIRLPSVLQVNLKGDAAQLLEPGLATAAPAAGAAPAAPAAAAVTSASSGEWSEEQELALVKALKTVGKDAEDRWGQVRRVLLRLLRAHWKRPHRKRPTRPAALHTPHASPSSPPARCGAAGGGAGAGEDQGAVLPAVQGAQGEPQGGKGQGMMRDSVACLPRPGLLRPWRACRAVCTASGQL